MKSTSSHQHPRTVFVGSESLLAAWNARGGQQSQVITVPLTNFAFAIDLIDYDPKKAPLFIGLSVEPRVHINAEATGPNKGMFLQETIPTESGVPPATSGPPVEPGSKP